MSDVYPTFKMTNTFIYLFLFSLRTELQAVRLTLQKLAHIFHYST